MNDSRQWLEQGLAALPAPTAQRVRVFRQVLAAAGMLRYRMDRALAGSGMTTQQAALLQFISAQPQPPTIGQVAAALGMSHQNVKQIALALQRKGLLDIAVDTRDRRARRLQVTPAMHTLWARRDADDFERVRAWTAALDDTEAAQLAGLLQRLIAGMAAQPAEPDAPVDAAEDPADRAG